MGIHYDYKSTRGEKAMKKEAKKKEKVKLLQLKKPKTKNKSAIFRAVRLTRLVQKSFW